MIQGDVGPADCPITTQNDTVATASEDLLAIQFMRSDRSNSSIALGAVLRARFLLIPR